VYSVCFNFPHVVASVFLISEKFSAFLISAWHKREEVTGAGRKLHNEEHPNIYTLHQILVGLSNQGG
jgi:hypothetical protein